MQDKNVLFWREVTCLLSTKFKFSDFITAQTSAADHLICFYYQLNYTWTHLFCFFFNLFSFFSSVHDIILVITFLLIYLLCVDPCIAMLSRLLTVFFLVFIWQTDKRDSQSNGCLTGFEVLLHKQLKGKQMQKEMAEFVRERYRLRGKNLVDVSVSVSVFTFLLFLSPPGCNQETTVNSESNITLPLFFVLINMPSNIAQHPWKMRMENQIVKKALCFPSQDKDRRGVRQESVQALADPSRQPGRRVSDLRPGENLTKTQNASSCCLVHTEQGLSMTLKAATISWL